MRYAYVGCRTTKERNARGKGIEVYKMDDYTGKWSYAGISENLVNPSYLAFDKTQKYLYAVHGDVSSVSSFSVNRETGLLTFLGEIDCEGENPLFIIPDHSNTHMLIANHRTGSVVAMPIKENGNLGPVAHKIDFPGVREGAVSHPHQVIYDRSESLLFVPTQERKAGYSALVVISFDPDKGFEKKFSIDSRKHSESRHVAVHPNNKYVYMINEDENTVWFYTFDAATGELVPVQIVSTMPETFTGKGQGSGLIITEDGRYVYASSRIHDSVTIFKAAEDGMLKVLGWVAVQKTPRFITADPTGKFFYVGNEDSDTIQTFRIEENGNLTYTGQTIASPSPTCIIFSER